MDINAKAIGYARSREGSAINKELPFAFEKKIGISECVYGNLHIISDAIRRLMLCAQETNKLHNVECEFFRLDFRQSYVDEQLEFPFGSLILHMKWGSKKELECKNENI